MNEQRDMKVEGEESMMFAVDKTQRLYVTGWGTSLEGELGKWKMEAWINEDYA